MTRLPSYLVRLGIVAAVIATAEVPVDRYSFRYTGEWRSCLWCGHHLRAGHPFFDTDRCGRLFAEQLCVRGYLLRKEELVDVNGDVRPHPP